MIVTYSGKNWHAHIERHRCASIDPLWVCEADHPRSWSSSSYCSLDTKHSFCMSYTSLEADHTLAWCCSRFQVSPIKQRFGHHRWSILRRENHLRMRRRSHLWSLLMRRIASPMNWWYQYRHSQLLLLLWLSSKEKECKFVWRQGPFLKIVQAMYR